ncbi:MAG: phosphoribosylglycinamide formyltransferase [bacterium]
MKIGVLASGRGSNFKVMCEAARRGDLGGEIAVLISDQPGAGAHAIAREFGVPSVTILPGDHPTREAHEDAVAAALEARGVGLICLAGYMRLLSPALVRRFPNRILNIHPSLLPSFPGMHAQRQALAHGARVSGVTVHLVDEGCDTGPIVLQAAVPVERGDTEETLSARILAEEHRLYPAAVRLFCTGKLRVDGRRVEILP